MSKAVLVIDMPRDCIDCPCYHVLNNKPICEVNGLTGLSSTNYDEERPLFCPLKLSVEAIPIEFIKKYYEDITMPHTDTRIQFEELIRKWEKENDSK